jgi:hypothetical protein
MTDEGLLFEAEAAAGDPDHVIHPAPAVERDIAARGDRALGALGHRA